MSQGTGVEKALHFWFPQAKIIPPRLDNRVIDRPHLLERVRQAVNERRLTLIAAPAGSGKTTLAAELAHGNRAFSLAWATLGVEDNDPVAFVALLVAALQRPAVTAGLAAGIVIMYLTAFLVKF